MNTETLSWDESVTLHGESILADGGYITRMHASVECANRLTDRTLVTRHVDDAPASNLCSECASDLVASAISSSVVLLRDLERHLQRLADVRAPRSSAVTLTSRITDLDGVHPAFLEAKESLLDAAAAIIKDLPVY